MKDTRPDSSINSYKYNDGFGDSGTTKGLTKREYFAAIALQGILANRELQFALLSDCKGDMNSAYAKEAVIQADLLIKALNK